MVKRRAKLHRQDGASIVLAMAVFLICGVLSITVVNGALSTVHNLTIQQKEEQAYLTVTSAARLFARLVERDMAGKVVVTETRKETDKAILDEEGNDSGEKLTIKDPETGWYTNPDLTYMQKVFWELIKSAEENPASKEPITGTITVPEVNDVKLVHDVRVSLTYGNLSSQNIVTAVFTLNASDDDMDLPSELACRCTVVFSCSSVFDPAPEIRHESEGDEEVETRIYERTMRVEVSSVERGRWTTES